MFLLSVKQETGLFVCWFCKKISILPINFKILFHNLYTAKWEIFLPPRFISFQKLLSGLPWWRSGWESACQCRGHGFEPWSRKIPHAAEQLSPCAIITEPMCHNYWSLHAWSLCSTAREATAMRGPSPATKSSPRSPQLEKAHVQQRRPNAAKDR